MKLGRQRLVVAELVNHGEVEVAVAQALRALLRIGLVEHELDPGVALAKRAIARGTRIAPAVENQRSAGRPRAARRSPEPRPWRRQRIDDPLRVGDERLPGWVSTTPRPRRSTPPRRAPAVLGARARISVTGWGFWGAYVFISGYVTLGFGGYAHAVTGVPVIAGALCLIAACLALNLLGVRVTGAAQRCGLRAWRACSRSRPGAALERSSRHACARSSRHVAHACWRRLPAILGGLDVVAAAGEEIERPERNLPRAILITLGAVLGLYLLVCYVAVGVMPSRALGPRRPRWPTRPLASTRAR